MKILILKPSSLGDVVHALPVLRLLKLRYPASDIYWWIDVGIAALLEGDPDLAGVISFDRKRWSYPWNWSELWDSLRRIRAHHFDWVIDLQSLARSGAMAWLANGRLLVGLDDAREGARGFYDVSVPRPSPNAHAVDWYRSVLTRLRVPTETPFTWMPSRPEVAAAVAAKWPALGKRWILLNPGARWENKRWPAHYFAATVRHFTTTRDDLCFAVIGGVSDRELGRSIAAANPQRCRDLTGRTSLWEMVEWIRRSELVVSNDTGPMHIAAALGKPVIALFGPTNPRRTGPYGQGHVVLQRRLDCVPCMKDSCAHDRPLECLQSITPELVNERIAGLLAARAPSSEQACAAAAAFGSFRGL